MELKRNGTICFLGDSITASGLWIKFIWETMKDYTRKIFNCGIPGDTAENAKTRIYETCLAYAPDYVVIMFGMNDICRELYLDAEAENQRKARIDAYADNLEEIINIIIQCGAMPILLTPTPYDDKSDSSEKNMRCNAGIDQCVKTVHLLAKKYSLPLIDFNRNFKEKMICETIIGPDRVHPNENGHKLMAKIFLNSVGFEIPEFKETLQNNIRYKTEQDLIYLRFVDYFVLYDRLKGKYFPVESKKQMCREMELSIAEGVSADKDFIKKALKNYIENADKTMDLQKELIELTLSNKNHS